MSGIKTDHLKQDPVIPGQDYTVVSFVNPKDMVLNKYLHYVNNFMVSDVNKSITAQAMQMARKLQADMRKNVSVVLDKLKFSVDEEDQHMGQILEKRFGEMCIDEDDYVEECRRCYGLDEQELTDRYTIFLANERTRLDKEFNDTHEHATSLRGFKVRGAYSRLADAQSRAKYLRDSVEPAIHTFVVDMGTWFPVDMDADEVQDQDYMLPALNDMMGKYHEGTHARNQHYRERKEEMVENAHTDRLQSTRSRLQDKLRQKRNEQKRKEMEAFQAVAKGDDASGASGAPGVSASAKKRRRRRKNKDKSAEGAPAV